LWPQKNEKKAVEIIREKRGGNLYSDGMAWDEVEDALEEVTKGYYFELFGGG
jgi:hypothetical protein